MSRAIAQFLLVFWLVGLALHLGGMIHLLALIAVGCFAVDFLAHARRERSTGEDPLRFL
jgi:hypothetical protein